MAAEPSTVGARSPRLARAMPEPGTIGICAPSGRVDEAPLRRGIAYLEDLGHRVVVAGASHEPWRYFAATDEERLAAFHQLVDDPSVDVVTLYGALDADTQDRAIAPSPPGRRKVVLATSIAETSLTIQGVRIVIDSGLARVPRYEPDVGVTRLETVRVSRAAADQRRGRAGRTEPGVCYRLWDEPQTASLDEGFKLEFHPLLSLDGRVIDAILKCEIDQVEKLVPVDLDVSTTVARQTQRIEVPQAISARLHERFHWPSDQVLLISLGVVPTPVPQASGVIKVPLLSPGSRADLLVFIKSEGKVSGQPTVKNRY